MTILETRGEFKQGQRKLIAPMSRADWSAAKSHFQNTLNHDPDFHRANGWMSYAIVTGFVEGYETADALPGAQTLARAAVDGDEADWDNHWALAIAQLYCEQWDDAKRSYENAIALCHDESAHLHFDYVHTLVYLGDNREAASLAIKTRGFNDWHKWNTAWAFFFLARTDMSPVEDSIFLDLAIEQIQSMRLPPGHPRYLADAQLLAAAIFMLRGDTASARNCISIFRAAKPGSWTIAEEMAVCRFDTRVAGSDGSKNSQFWEDWAGAALALP